MDAGSIYQSNKSMLPGSSCAEVKKVALRVYRTYTASTKRQPYVRSAYFNKSKVFLNYFWQHLVQKSWRERTRRLKLLEAGLDLVRHAKTTPITKQNPNVPDELLHRFEGRTKNGIIYFVQIKEDKKNDKKFLLSVFPK